MSARLVAVAIGLSLGNYLYQFIGAQDYAVATSRSFFECLAVLASWIAIKDGV